MQLNPEDMIKVRNRLSRASGQLNAVIRLIDEGGDCEAIVTQLAACSKALDRAGYTVVATGLRQCMTDPENAMPPEKLEKLFLSFS